MTEIIGIEPQQQDNAVSVAIRVKAMLENKGVLCDYSFVTEGVRLMCEGMSNKRRASMVIAKSTVIPEDEIEPRSISIANEVEAAIRQARDPEAE